MNSEKITQKNNLQLSNSIEVQAPFAVVLELLRIENLTRFNPLIKSVTPLESVAGVTKMEIVDVLPFGPFNFDLTYVGSQEVIEILEDHAVFQNDATSPLFLTPNSPLVVKNTVTVNVLKDMVSIEEHSEIIFPGKPGYLPNTIWNYFVNYTIEKTNSSHQEMYQRLKQVAEAEA